MAHVSGLRSTLWLCLAVVGLAACDHRVYVRDGVTDGDRFALPTVIKDNDHPATQAWVAYSLAKSFCQLESDAPIPSRHSSFGCERTAREALLTRWRDYPSFPVDRESDYLEALSAAEQAGFLDEYIWRYLGQRGWERPDDLQMTAFETWAGARLADNHRPRTRIIGSWGYAASPE